MVVQTADEAVSNANGYTRCDPGYCLKYVRTWLEIPSGADTAFHAWQAAEHKHAGDKTPPRGAPLFWKSSPSGSGAGHITICKGDTMRTTDKSSPGYVNNDNGAWPKNAWGQSYLGWTEDLNGIWIPYLKGGGSQESPYASGKVYVEKLVRKQQDSDSVARLCYRMMKIKAMPSSHAPPHLVHNYSEELLEAVRYWQRNIMHPVVNGPTDGTSVSNPQANQIFGDNYNVIEK